MLRLAFWNTICLLSHCSGVRVTVGARLAKSREPDGVLARESEDQVTTSDNYTAYFGDSFNLLDVDRELRQLMCDKYFMSMALPVNIACERWVTENVVIRDGPLLTARAGDPSNPLVVFVHGWPDSAALWVNQFALLSVEYHCVAVQLPNHLSSLPTEQFYLDDLVDRLGAVLADLGRPAYLVGHDLGAALGFMAAYRLPDAVLRLAALGIGNDKDMLSPAEADGWYEPGDGSEEELPTLIAYHFQHLAAAYADCTLLPDAVRIITETIGAPLSEASCRMGLFHRRMLDREEYKLRFAPSVASGSWESLWTPSGGMGIPQRNMLYMFGSDLATTKSFREAVTSEGGRVVELEGVGHWLPMHAAADVTEALAVWLAEAEGRGGVDDAPSTEFSLPAIEASLKGQMCDLYFNADAHPAGTSCMEWVTANIRVEGGPLVSLHAGDESRPILVFVHGWPDSAAVWINQLMRWSTDYHCIAFQLPNFLDALPTEELHVTEVTDRINAYLNGRPCYFVGHGLGAVFAYVTAYRFPEVVKTVAALDVGNDIAMLAGAWSEQPVSWSFISLYEVEIAEAYRHCELEGPVVRLLARASGSPNSRVTCRMGMYHDQLQNRSAYTRRVAPDMREYAWASLWTPLEGTGIQQDSMLYVRGSSMATTESFVVSVQEDNGTFVDLTSAGHWLPTDGALQVNVALGNWLADVAKHPWVPHDTEIHEYTACPSDVIHDLHAQGFTLTDRRSSGKFSVYVKCIGGSNLRRNKVLCDSDVCNGPWCFVPNGCSSRFGLCWPLEDQNPLRCQHGVATREELLRIVDDHFARLARNPQGLLETYGPHHLSGGTCGANCQLPHRCPLEFAGGCRYDVYDNALAALYFTKRGHIQRAREILDGFRRLLYPRRPVAHSYGPGGMPSGRTVALLAAAYTAERANAGDYWMPAVSAAGYHVDIGNNAWAGLALAKFGAAVDEPCYTEAARDILHVLRQEARCDDELGGFMGRLEPGPQHYRSVEHNIDVFALARALGEEEDAESAAKFVRSMHGANTADLDAYNVGTGNARRCDNSTYRAPVAVDSVMWSVAASADGADSEGHGRQAKAMRSALRPARGGMQGLSTSYALHAAGSLHSALGSGGHWAEDVDHVGGEQGLHQGDVYHGFRFSTWGRGIQWENTASGAIAMAHFQHQFGSPEGVDVSAHLSASRGSLKRLLQVYGAVPASIVGGNYGAWRRTRVVAAPWERFTGGSDTGLGWTYLRYPHLAATAWTGLALMHQFEDGGKIDDEANPYSMPSRPVHPAGSAGRHQCEL